MNYEEFLNAKKHSVIDCGIKPNFMPEAMFDFQKYVAEYSIKRGRCACFLDTGLGKTIIELTVARNYILTTNKPVLIITPLAVAFQFIKEAAKFDIGDIEYSKNGKYKSKIVVCNYERLHYFNSTDFDCVILDESSILKNVDGAIKSQVTTFLKKVKYRFLFTATPSPNDFIELGTSSEALGYLGYMDMITRFFTNNANNSIGPSRVREMNIGVEWVLKGHAQEKFFKWVSGWSISIRKPSDLGFSDDRFKLPELIINYHSIENKEPMIINGQFQLIRQQAVSREEIAAEVRQTINERCEIAVELSEQHDHTVYWTNLNTEADLIEKLDKDARQVSGRMDVDEKEEILLAFANGQIKNLITKPKITSFGLNWQHCNHTTYFPTFSYEQWYQGIRRFWRFGQQREVIADMIHSDGQIRVINALLAKAKKADQLFSKLNSALHKKFEIKNKEFDKTIKLPNFI